MRMHRYFKAFLVGGIRGWVSELGKTLKDEFATNGDRKRAIEMLSFLPARWAVPELLKRYDIVVDSGMHERSEKEEIARLIAGEGPSVVPMVVAYAHDAKHLAWPIRILEQVMPRAEFVTVLLGMVSASYPAFDTRVISRNRDIFLGLRDVIDERIPEVVAPHLACRYPEVVSAALECLNAARQA